MAGSFRQVAKAEAGEESDAMNGADALLFTASRLAMLARMDRRAVERKLLGVIPAKIRGQARYFTLSDALPALVTEPEDAAAERRIREHREREAGTRADLNEIELLKQTKELVFAKDVALVFADATVATRQTIEKADYLKSAQKTRLLSALAKIKLEPLD